jgi:predicted RNA binding protein YcfA (HicA-like mRNA interferase family)
MSDRGWRKSLVEILKADGWRDEGWKGPHQKWRHPDKPGSIAVPYRVNDRRMALEIAKKQAGIPDVRL